MQRVVSALSSHKLSWVEDGKLQIMTKASQPNSQRAPKCSASKPWKQVIAGVQVQAELAEEGCQWAGSSPSNSDWQVRLHFPEVIYWLLAVPKFTPENGMQGQAAIPRSSTRVHSVA